MPSEDTYHKDRPEVNDWLERDEHGALRLKVATSLDSYRDSAQDRAAAKQAAHLQKLAADLGVDPEDLAERISGDNLRRLKFPMLHSVDAEGLHHFEHDKGIYEGIRPNLGVDRGQVDHPLVQPGPPRDASGRFSK